MASLSHTSQVPLVSPMQAPPTNISQDDMKAMFGVLDLDLNRLILQSLLHGLYTGIVAVTIWTIFSSPKRLRSSFLSTIIIALYVLSTIAFGIDWAFKRHTFIQYGDNYYRVYTALVDDSPWWRANYLAGSINGGVSTLLVDITIIWRCWILWDYRWRVIFVPIVCVVGSTAMKIMQMFSDIRTLNDNISKNKGFAAEIDWSLIYVILMLAITVLCTLLIVYRIVRHAPGMSASRKIVEIFIESSAMYSLSLIIYVALVSKNLGAGYYVDTIAAYIRAIAPTLLVGRVSAHTNTVLRRQKMVATWANHPPLVGCFREEDASNSHVYHCPDDGHQMLSGSLGKETV
ncbi:hypothetical protein ARMSODRAFT_964056 [Armillaria solidipes]|uniref:Uncharacterized protein n=1 Tax=Armillaria solidipes TaxID=1076256 RepID=A0A2H3BD87_9AGAR|nr:hypothetical protein ARMSODRAFT_964056 [Armillaria solidipes]